MKNPKIQNLKFLFSFLFPQLPSNQTGHEMRKKKSVDNYCPSKQQSLIEECDRLRQRIDAIK